MFEESEKINFTALILFDKHLVQKGSIYLFTHAFLRRHLDMDEVGTEDGLLAR